jgi:DNA-directed RNA polymerase specialized sigma subunit
LDRLHDPIVAALADYGQLLPELHREVGLAYFLRKRSFTQIEREYGLSRYAVKRMVQYIQGWHEASRATSSKRRNGTDNV